MNRRHTIVSSSFAFLPTFILACATDTPPAASDDSVGSVYSDLLVAPSGLWSGTIEVCWDINSTQVDRPGETRFANARNRVRQAIQRTWESFSRVHTTGWNNCPRAAPFGDRVLITARDGRARASIGKTSDNYIGIDLAAAELEAVAIHEFGHTLGFYHEQSDPRTPSTCTNNDNDLRSNPSGSIAVSDWDPLSIMNYCNDNWSNGLLSHTDISGVQRFYGRRPHDTTGDRRDDIVLVSGESGDDIYVGVSLPGSTFEVQLRKIPSLGALRSQGGRIVSGDFDGDGRQDFALVGGNSEWNTIPVAFSQVDGSYKVTNYFAPQFPAWSRATNVTAVVEDYNADGRADIALAGNPDWGSTPIALSRGDGHFDVINPGAGNFAVYASQPGAKVLAGDFDGDGYGDLALTGGTGWSTIPVRFTRRTGSGIAVTNIQAADFATYAQQGATPLTGDFNGDGRTDIVLTGGTGWNTIPLALSLADGSFRVWNIPVDGFTMWATQGSIPVVGDFNDDGMDDIALVGPSTWMTVPIATATSVHTFSGFFPNFLPTNNRSDLALWAAISSSTRPVTNSSR
jgi:hypothetical protein